MTISGRLCLPKRPVVHSLQSGVKLPLGYDKTPENEAPDYFLAATRTGHDTSYSPNGERVNPREEYQYGDVDSAINQPKLNLRATDDGIGLSIWEAVKSARHKKSNMNKTILFCYFW